MISQVEGAYSLSINGTRAYAKKGENSAISLMVLKSWLIVKTSELAESAKKVFGDEVNITLKGRLHLGAVIGSRV